ncbi:hypothetical protein Q7P37_001605 [Cladosporium fusiforme]
MKHPLLFILLAVMPHALANCECGFSINRTNSEYFGLFTDMLETDFLHASNVTYTSIGKTGWLPQVYNTSAEDSRGDYGTSKQLGNIVANPLPDGKWGGSPATVGDAGLQLWVRSSVENGHVPVAEVVSPRSDILYGSFRAAIKFSAMNGTCGAFFWYHNDSQEIDVEFLSNKTSSVEFVVHTDEPSDYNFGPGSKKSDGSSRFTSIMDFTEDYHEYRFDWLPDRVDYYVDGMLSWTARDRVPHSRGILMLSHWSNGNPGWSGGPPMQDAVITVGYIKAYFNVTSRDEPKSGCRDLNAEGSVCAIEDQNTPPNPDGHWTKFFSIPAPPGEEEDLGSGSGYGGFPSAKNSASMVAEQRFVGTTAFVKDYYDEKRHSSPAKAWVNWRFECNSSVGTD